MIHQMEGLLQRGAEVGVICNGLASLDHIDATAEPMATLLHSARDWWGGFASLRPHLTRLPYSLRDKASTLMETAAASTLNSFDVLLAHFGDNGIRVCRHKKRGLVHPPLVTIFHGADVGVPRKENRLGDYRDLFRLGALNLPVNGHFREVLIGAGASPDKVEVHHMGIDVEQIPFRWRDRQGDILQLISVCRLAEKKGIEFSLRALGQLTTARPELDWRYTIIGDGPLRGELEKLSADLGIAERVQFLGSQPHKVVKNWLARAHVFVLPSVTAQNGDVEGIPVALMEAMAAGLTVVSTRHSGIPELIEHGVGGFLSPERDVEALAANLAWIIEHPGECRQIAVAARRKIETDFNDTVLNDQLAARLEAIASSGSRKRVHGKK
ncbi:glycosyltransferase [Rhizobium paknamense]|uniref:Colanic acid/amylovoran biosynthesis glycosyltransferase n=1 Tax=Rhizobium paknamense TaxID=1206817 RepID=A0ABU0IK48_9HYPH|nr:glycosyltransferase [Rhizobium paknamense]MDQ0458003.1 colanic acid/amylovoran biosynthesis glycosyltransferase [Rhizobium paknamense]